MIYDKFSQFELPILAETGDYFYNIFKFAMVGKYQAQLNKSIKLVVRNKH